MAKENFPPCLQSVLKHEGGYVDHPADPGGATNMGITQGTLGLARGHAVSKQDVRNIQMPEVAQIYRQRYWDAVRGDDLPVGLDLVAFDGAINSGPSRGVRWLQIGVGARVDGRIGPETVTKARMADVPAAITAACAARMGFLRGLRHWPTFGRGWSRRVAETEAAAIAMYLRDVEAPPVVVGAVATKKAITAKAKSVAEVKSGAAQGGGVVAAGGAGGQADVVPPEMVPWIIGAVVIGVILIALRTKLRRGYQLDRATAFQELEVVQ